MLMLLSMLVVLILDSCWCDVVDFCFGVADSGDCADIGLMLM